MNAYLRGLVTKSRGPNGEDGLTLVDYAFIFGLVALAASLALLALGGSASDAFQVASDALGGGSL